LSLIKDLKARAVQKLGEMLDSENETIALKSCAAVLELPDADEADAALLERLGDLLGGPAPNRDPEWGIE